MKSRRLDVSTSMNGRVNSWVIPMNVIVEIFSWLPAKTIARFRCLSKRCASVLELGYFKELFWTKSFIEPQY
ncbi:F-box protein DOR [Cardamine amara subsp. amara]|uniref:F-box protein DOR n=1 Tax=Cardamine amara subsp. amara TaxID=228776 RepID=A0ABD1BQF3_CARAN